MRFKDRSQLTDLWVELDDPQGNKMRIPSSGGAQSMTQLITLVDLEIKALERQGFNYVQPLQMQADKQKMSYRVFLATIIENMICMRHPRPQEACYSDGIGDKFHFLTGKIDRTIASLPKPLGRVAKRLVQAATHITSGKSYQQLSSCSKCGGTRSITPLQSNLGRAGTLNAMERRFRKK